MNTPRMTEKELAEHERRVRISRTKTGWLPKANGRVRGGAEGRTSNRNRGLGRAPVVAIAERLGQPVSSPAPSPLMRPRETVGAYQSFFVPGPLPGANDIIRKHRMVYSKLKAQWGLTIARVIIVSKLRRVRACTISFLWQEKHNRRDDDNIMFGQKFVLDALRDTKIIPDDRRQFVHALTHRIVIDPSQPGVLVTIEEAQP